MNAAMMILRGAQMEKRFLSHPHEEMHEWVGTLPGCAAQVVANAEIGAPHVFMGMHAVPEQLRPMRLELAEWAREMGIGRDKAADILLAADEAVSNAIEHACSDSSGPSTVTVLAVRNGHAPKVHVIVSDTGAWRSPPADAGARGRGLAIMEAAAHSFDVHHNPRGTTVLLDWSLP